MANPDEDVDKKELEDDEDDSDVELVTLDQGYNFPEDPERWTVEDLGEAWITEKISEHETSEDDDRSSVTSSDTDVSIHFSIEEEISYYTSSDDDTLSDNYQASDKEMDRYRYRDRDRDTDSEYERIDLNTGFGWDPDLAGKDSRKIKRMREKEIELEEDEEDEEEEELVNYVPYHRSVPSVPDNCFEITDEREVVEELDRIEEALKWASFVFDDGCTYEGTIWDDVAQGKGVFTTPLEICRYEGEWHQNMMQGHGVLEVDIPDEEPAPDSELAQKMREQGKILKSDYMSPEDREWLIMDINDKKLKRPRRRQVYDKPEWIDYFGEMPERGHYRYAGQWKHGRMHGCGVYEVNRRLVWGKFYFGELEPDPVECTAEISAMHLSLAEVAAAKARMFVNKPDGMVRELKGPYSDPQHPYMYEEEDMWMAPGFINQFYEVPEVWQRYVHDVDQEREMWLNSYYKSPLRIPMPAELENWWSKDPEFLVIPDIKDPEKELLMHVPTNQLINWSEDPDGQVRLFWEPVGEKKPDDPFLPLDFDEFMGENKDEKARIAEAKLKMELEKEEQARNEALQQKVVLKKNDEEEKRKLVDLDLQYLKAQEKTEGALDDVETEVNKKLVFEETVEPKAQEKEPKETPGPEDSEGGPSQDYEEEEEEEDDGDKKPRSFGTVAFAESQCYQRSSDGKTDKHGRSSSATPTLFASLSMVSMVAVHKLNPFASWLKSKRCMPSMVLSPCFEGPGSADRKTHNASTLVSTDVPMFINYPLSRNKVVRLKAGKSDQNLGCRNTTFSLHCTQLGFAFHVLSQLRYPSPKPNKSYVSKKCQENKRREQKRSRKYYSNKLWETMHGIFSLSIPVEELGC